MFLLEMSFGISVLSILFLIGAAIKIYLKLTMGVCKSIRRLDGKTYIVFWIFWWNIIRLLNVFKKKLFLPSLLRFIHFRTSIIKLKCDYVYCSLPWVSTAHWRRRRSIYNSKLSCSSHGSVVYFSGSPRLSPCWCCLRLTDW